MNLYWSVYKNLEKELKKLADIVHINDNQNTVYSIHIADLLIRTSIEIEAISKHLYEVNGGNMSPVDDRGEARVLFFDTDCIQELDKKWHITKKVVNVVASNFYFEKEENRILRPLKNCNKYGKGRWKKAYQAVKHDRVNNLREGNIGNLIRAMAALFLLNIYNLDERIIDINNDETTMDNPFASDVFSVNIYKATTLSMGIYMDDSCILQEPHANTKELLDASTLIYKYTDDSYREMYKNHMKDINTSVENAKKSKQIQSFIEQHPEYSDKSLNEICFACGEESERIRLGIKEGEKPSIEQEQLIEKAGQKMLVSIIDFSNVLNGNKAKKELSLNKLMPIYPSL